jgi:malate synthase
MAWVYHPEIVEESLNVFKNINVFNKENVNYEVIARHHLDIAYIHD